MNIDQISLKGWIKYSDSNHIEMTKLIFMFNHLIKTDVN